MNFDVSQILIVLLLIVIALLALKLFKKEKIKQTRYKSDSGDTVKSRAELIVANWLFYRGIEFIYEKKAPTSSTESPASTSTAEPPPSYISDPMRPSTRPPSSPSTGE